VGAAFGYLSSNGAGNNNAIGLPGALGTFTQSGGSHATTGALIVGQGGDLGGGNGHYALSGDTVTSTLTTGATRVGDGGLVGGVGMFDQSGGTHTTDQLFIGSGNGNGTYNLSGTGVLHVNDVTYVGEGGTALLTQSGTSQFATNFLNVGIINGSKVTYDLSAGTVTVNNNMGVGGSGNGTVNQTGGIVTVGDTLRVDGKGDGSTSGQYTLSGGALTSTLTTGNLVVGDQGIGKFDQSGGTVNVNKAGETMYVGNGEGSTGTYTLSGGELNVTTSEEKIGGFGTGYFNQSGGVHNFTGAMYLGDQSTSTGEYHLTGGTLAAGGIALGEWGGTGKFFQDETVGGSSVTTGWLDLARQKGATGTYELSNGTLHVTGGETVGSQGIGTFTQTGGTHTVDGLMTLGRFAEDTGNNIGKGVGTYNLQGGTLNDSLIVGDAGIGTFNNSGGTHNVTGDLTLGSQATGDGTYNLSGTGKLSVTGHVNDGDQGTGHIVQGAGTTAEAASLTLGTQIGSQGNYQLNGGSLHTTSGYLVVGDQGHGTFTQTGGSVTADNVLVVGQSAASTGSGTYTLSGGTVSSGNFLAGDAGIGQFTNSGGTQIVTNADAILGSQAGSVGTYTLSGTGSLNVTGNPDASLTVGDHGAGHFKQEGGTVTSNWLDVGYNSTGSDYVQSGGSNNVTNTLWVGRNAGAEGSYQLQDGILTTDTTTVGVAGKGTFDQTGASSVHNTGTVVLGYLAGGSGIYNLVDGTLTSDWERIGLASKGVFTQTGGSNTVATTVVVGQDAGGDGTYSLKGGQLKAGYETIGRYNDSVGLFDQTGGSNTVTNDLNVGGQGSSPNVPGTGATGQGTYQLTGGDLTVGGTTYVGNQGTGIFEQKNSTHTTGSLVLGSKVGSTGSYILTPVAATLLKVTGNEVVGDAGAGTFTQHAGEHTVGGDLVIASQATAGGSSFTLDTTAGPSSLAVSGTLFVGNDSSGGFNLNSGSLTTHNSFIGNNGTGTFTQTGGTHTVLGTPGGTGNLFVGVQNGATGTYNQSGGDTTAPAVGVGVAAGSHGIYNLSGGSLTGGLALGYGGQGDFHQSNADGASTVVVNNNLHLGELTGSSGSYTLDGGTSSLRVTGTNKNEIIGVGGAGTFTQNAGTHSVEGILSLGGKNATLGTGTYSLNGGSLTVGTNVTPGWAFVGENGTGTLTQSNAASATVNGNLVLGGQAGSQGTYTLNGGTLDVAGTGLTGGNLAVGHRGQGTFTQNGGQVATSELQVAGGPSNGSATAQGSYNLNSGTLTATVENIGNTGNGSLTQSEGSANQADSVTLGASVGSSGTYQLNGGILTATSLTVGDSGQGTFNQTGGSSAVTNAVEIAKNAGAAGSAYSLSGGSLTAESMNVNAGGTLDYSGGSLSLGSGSGTLSNAGQVNVSGAGTRTVDADVVNNGNFKVTDTTVSYTGSFTNNGGYHSDPSTNIFTNLTVGVNGYLTGGLGDVFQMQGDYFNQSTQYTLWDTSKASLEFTGTTHQMGTTGAFGNFAWGSFILDHGAGLNLNGILTVGLFDLMDGLDQLNSFSGTFDLWYDKTLAGNAYLLGQDFIIGNGRILAYESSSVPEPATLTLFGFGLFGLLFRRRRA